MRGGRRPLAAIAAACVLCTAIVALAVAPAGGAVPSKVRIRIGFETATGDPYFAGRIRSQRKSCTRNRRVRIYRQLNRPGRRHLVRVGRSDRRGFYRVDMFPRMKTAGYFANAKPKRGCEGANSKVIAVGQRGPGGVGPGGGAG